MHNALGEKCEHQHEFSVNNKLALCLASHVVLGKAIQLLVTQLAAIEGSKAASFQNELTSMEALATLMQLEVLHYTKHQAQGWWQALAEKELTKTMIGDPSIKLIKSNHKNKTLAQSEHEAMSEYFSKHGISCCGNYIIWWGTRDGCEGFLCGSLI